MDSFDFKKYLAEGKLLKESSISKLKDKVKDMSKEDFLTLVKKVGDLDKWKNASKGKFDDGTPIRPFSNASDRIEVIDNNFEEEDAEKYLAEGKLQEFRRTGRQYKAQGQGGSAGNRRAGIMRGPSNYDLEDDDEEYTSKGDPNIDKGDFYDYSAYGFTIRFLGYEDGDQVIIRGNAYNSGKVKNGKVTFKSYPMKDAKGNRLGDLGTPNSTYKLSDNYNENQIADVLGNKHPFVLLTKSGHWKNNHSIDIDDNSISITLDTPNNLPRGLAPHAKLSENNFNFKKYLAEGKLLKEAINLDIIDDIAILTGDSGEYEGEIEDDGTVSFSVIFDKQGLDTRIIDQYDESNIDEFLGKDHAFVELSKKYDHNWDIEPDLVGITIKLT